VKVWGQEESGRMAGPVPNWESRARDAILPVYGMISKTVPQPPPPQPEPEAPPDEVVP